MQVQIEKKRQTADWRGRSLKPKFSDCWKLLSHILKHAVMPQLLLETIKEELQPDFVPLTCPILTCQQEIKLQTGQRSEAHLKTVHS